MILSVVPERLWQVIGTDICYIKKCPYLIKVDFIKVSCLPSLSSPERIRALKSMLARHGMLEVVCSDNCPQYDSVEFAKFAKVWEFKLVTRSPLYAQSNGEAERAVQTAKNLLKKEDDPVKALLTYPSTPLYYRVERAHLSYSMATRFDAPLLAFQNLSNRAGQQ